MFKQNLSTLLSGAACLLAALCLLQIGGLRRELQNVQGNLDGRILQVQSAVRDIYLNVDRRLEEEANLLSHSHFTLSHPDYEQFTATLFCQVTPREYRPGETEAVLFFNGTSLPLTLSGGVYRAETTVSMLEPLQVTGVQFSEAGAVRTQTLAWAENPGELFLPLLNGRWSGSARGSGDAGEKIYTYRMEGTVRATVECKSGQRTVQSVMLVAAVDGREIERIAMPSGDGEDATPEAPVAAVTPAAPASRGYSDRYTLELDNKEFLLPFGSTLELYVEATDSAGLCYRAPLRSIAVDAEGNQRDEQETPPMAAGTEVYDAEGNLLFSRY